MFGIFRSKAHRELDSQVSEFARDVTYKMEDAYMRDMPMPPTDTQAMAAIAFQVGLVFEVSKGHFGTSVSEVSDPMAETFTRKVWRERGNPQIVSDVLRTIKTMPHGLVARSFEVGRHEAENFLHGVPDNDTLLGLMEREHAALA